MSDPTTEEATPTEPLSERRERLVDRKVNRPIVKIVPDRRRHRRVPVGVVGRFMREDKREYPCQVVNMSAGGMAILAPVTCAAFAPPSAAGETPYAASGTKDGFVYLWAVPTKEEVRTHRITDVPVKLLAKSIEAGSRQVRLGVELANPTGRLYPGRPVTIVFE